MTMEDGYDAGQAMDAAQPQEVDAQRGFLQQALGMLGGQGGDVGGLLAQAGVGTADANQMSHGDLIQTTLALAQQHPEIVAMVAQQFPKARGILGLVLGGGLFGGLLGQILGR